MRRDMASPFERAARFCHLLGSYEPIDDRLMARSLNQMNHFAGELISMSRTAAPKIILIGIISIQWAAVNVTRAAVRDI